MEYNWSNFVVVSLSTIIPFLWLAHRPKGLRYYFLPFLFFIFVYAGIGAGWQECPADYTYMYVIYMFLFGAFCCFFTIKRTSHNYYLQEKKNKQFEKRISKATSIIDSYGGYVVFIYIFLGLLKLYLSGNIMNLITPPEVDLRAFVDEQFNGDENESLATILINNLMILLHIFYLLCMYKYRNSILKIALCQIVPLYIEYAASAYIGRGVMMMAAMMIVIAFCVKYPQYKKKLFIGVLIISPLLIYGLVLYSYRRIGQDMSETSMNDIFYLLFFQETRYPILYSDISRWNFDSNLAASYFSWIFNLPLPGSLKLDNSDFYFNFIFTEKLTGNVRGTPGFSVALPGIVGESIFIFGHYLFWIHAFILAFFLTTVYKLLKYKYEIFLIIYCSVCLAYTLGRAGTTTIYPFYLKLLLLYLILRFFVLKKNNILS